MSVLFEGVMAPEGLIHDRKPLQEALVYTALSQMSVEKRQSFRKTPECKYLVENDIISGDTLDRLANDEFGDRATELVVCHMAKEQGDDRWDELLRHREEERRLMNELIAQYGDAASTYAESVKEDIVFKCVPKRYLEG